MIRLHHVPFSRSFRVLWLLEELGLPFDIVQYSIRDGSLRAPEFLAISPAGRVPALEIGDKVYFESGAILQFLCEEHPEARLAPEAGDEERARYLEMIGYGETMANLIETLNLQHIFLRDPSRASPVVIKLVTARLAAVMAGLEALIGDQDYLLPSGFSVADVMMGFNLFAAPYYVKMDPFAKLKAYRDRLRHARPTGRRAARTARRSFMRKSFTRCRRPE